MSGAPERIWIDGGGFVYEAHEPREDTAVPYILAAPAEALIRELVATLHHIATPRVDGGPLWRQRAAHIAVQSAAALGYGPEGGV